MTQDISNAELLSAINDGFTAQTKYIDERTSKSEGKMQNQIDHLGVKIEFVESDVKLTLEGVSTLNQKMDDVRGEVSITKRIEKIEHERGMTLEEIVDLALA